MKITTGRIPMGGLAVATFWLGLSGIPRKKPDRAVAPAREAGYSIFHETTTDRAWPDIEKAVHDNVDKARAFVPEWCRTIAEAIAHI